MSEGTRSACRTAMGGVTLVAAFVFAWVVVRVLFSLPFFLLLYFGLGMDWAVSAICSLFWGYLAEAVWPGSRKRRKRKRPITESVKS